MYPKVAPTDFRTILIDKLSETLKSYDLPSDPKELEDLAKRVVKEYIKIKNHENNIG